MIIDDDDGAREVLQRLLADDAQVEVVAIAKDGLEALRMIEKTKPDLVFMDIDMPHLSGIDVARNLLGHRPLIIFATAFDRYAIEAFELAAVDYILKPFTRERVQHGLTRAQALAKRTSPFAYEQFLQSKESFSHARKISFHDGSELLIVDMDGISCIETEGRYVRVFHDGVSHLFEESLANIFLRLDKSIFAFASRGAIINLAHVVNLRRLGIRKFTVVLDDPKEKEVAVARNRVNDLRKRLSEIAAR